MNEESKGEDIHWLCNHGPVGISCLEGGIMRVGQNVSQLRKTEQGGEGGVGDAVPARPKPIVGVCGAKLIPSCTNCLATSDNNNAKHISFEDYINNEKKLCLHGPKQRCPHCTLPTLPSYKVKKYCPNHPPYPRGLCTTCAPKPCTLARQVCFSSSAHAPEVPPRGQRAGGQPELHGRLRPGVD